MTSACRWAMAMVAASPSSSSRPPTRAGLSGWFSHVKMFASRDSKSSLLAQ